MMYPTLEEMLRDIRYRCYCLVNPKFRKQKAAMEYAAFLSHNRIPRWMKNGD